MFIYLLMFIWICKSRLYRNFRLVFENNLGLYLDDNILRLLVFLLLKMDFLFWLRLERKAEGQLGRMEVESPWPDFSKFDHDPQQLFRPKVIFLWSRTTRLVLKCLKSIWASIFRELNPKAKAFWLWTKLSVLFTLKKCRIFFIFSTERDQNWKLTILMLFRNNAYRSYDMVSAEKYSLKCLLRDFRMTAVCIVYVDNPGITKIIPLMPNKACHCYIILPEL